MDELRKFDTIAGVNYYAVLMVTNHTLFMNFLIVFALLSIDTYDERYALYVKA